MLLSPARTILVTFCGVIIVQNAHGMGWCEKLTGIFRSKPEEVGAPTVSARFQRKPNPLFDDLAKKTGGQITIEGAEVIQVQFLEDSDSFNSATYKFRFPAKTNADGWLVYEQIIAVFNNAYPNHRLNPFENDKGDFETGTIEARRLLSQYDQFQGYEVRFHSGRGETLMAEQLLEVLKRDFQLKFN